MVAVTAGALLLATPLLGDSEFRRTVVLVLEAGEDGAVGVILNRPSHRTMVVAEPWASLACAPEQVFDGGPVDVDALIALADGGCEPADGYLPLAPGVGSVDTSVDPSSVAVERVRFFAGYAGWSAGQLEAELAADAWLLCLPLPGDVFTSDPQSLYARVARRHPAPISLWSTLPDLVERN